MDVKGYSRTQIALHWAIVVLIGVNYVMSDGMGRALDTVLKGGTPTGLTPVVHVYVGIAVLVLVALRLVLRMGRGVPPEPETGSDMMRKVGKYTHYGLYALMFVVPAAGMGAWYLGIRNLGEMHEVMFNLLMILAALHAAAALFHQYVLKDGLLRRMMRAE